MDKENLHGQMAEFIKGYTLMVKERAWDKLNYQMVQLLLLISKMESHLVWLFINLMMKRKTFFMMKKDRDNGHAQK